MDHDSIIVTHLKHRLVSFRLFWILAMRTRTTWLGILPWTCCLLMGVLAAGAQLAPEPLRTPVGAYSVRAWSTEHGLPQNWVERLLQTRDGYLWAGTRSGLGRFDGKRIVAFQQEDTPGLSSAVKALLEDSAGRLWIGLKDGVLVRESGGFRKFTKADGLGDSEVTSLAVSRRGGIWAGTGLGMSYYDGVKWTNYPAPQQTKHKLAYSVHEDSKGNLWAGFATGLYRLDEDRKEFERVWSSPEPVPREHYDIVTCIAEGAGGIWFGTLHGLYCLGEGQVRERGFPEISAGQAGPEVKALLFDSRGRLWVIAGNELYAKAEERFASVGLKRIIGNSPLLALCEDREGNLWVGSGFHGTIQIKAQRVEVLTTADGLSHEEVWSISEGRDGGVWIATSAGLNRWKAGRFEPIPVDRDVSQVSLRSAIEDRFGNLWLGTAFSGLQFFFHTNGVYRYGPTASAHTQTRGLFEDRSTNLWVGTREGLVRFAPKPGKLVAQDQRYYDYSHVEQWMYRPDRTWFWAAWGERWERAAGDWMMLAKNDPNPYLPSYRPHLDWRKEMPEGRFADWDFRWICEGRKGGFWFATAHGLNRWHGGRITALTLSDGLPADDLWALHEDSEETLWLAGGSGLIRFKDGKFRAYGPADGLPKDRVNLMIEDDFGNLWLGGNRGIYRVNRRELNTVAEGQLGRVFSLALTEADGLLSSETTGRCQPAACKTRDGKLWIPTTRGVAIIDPARVGRNEVTPPVVVEELWANERPVLRDGRLAEKTAGAKWRSAQPANQPLLELGAPGREFIEIHYTANSFTAPDKVLFRYRLNGYDSDWRAAGPRRVAYYTNLKPGSYRFEVAASNNDGVWSEPGAALAFTVNPFFYERRLFRTAALLALSAAGFGMFRWQLRRQRHTANLEQQLALAEERARERTRIARDIHDDLGANLIQVSVLSDLMVRDLDSRHPAAAQARKIASVSNDMCQAMDEIVWAITPRNDTVRSSVAYLREYAAEYVESAGLEVETVLSEPLPDLPFSAEVRHHLFLILKEVLHNVVEHAQARRVSLDLGFTPGTLTMQVTDDGRGFDVEEAVRAGRGNGLENLKVRARGAGGELRVQSRPGAGTTVCVSVPLPPMPGGSKAEI